MSNYDSPAHGQVHRFRDKVGAWLGTGEQQYLSPEQAIEFGQALIHAATEIQNGVSFIDSRVGTVLIGGENVK